MQPFAAPSRRAVLMGTAAVGVALGAWTVLASTGFTMGTGLPRFYAGGASYEWWSYYFHAPRGHRHWPFVQKWLAWSGLAAAVPVGAALSGAARFAWRRRGAGPKLGREAADKIVRGTSDNHGHADWLSMDDALCLFPGEHPEWGGVVVGEAYRVDHDSVASMPFDPREPATWGTGGTAPLLIDPCTHGPTHCIRYSGSGGGKTAGMIASLLHWRGPAVVVDPSREIGPVTRRAREAMGQKVLEIAPGGAGFNVLAGIDPASPNAVRRILSVTASICGEEPDRAKDAIFDNAGRNLVACLIADLIHDPRIPREDKTLDVFIQAVTTPEVRMKALLASIARDTHSGLARLLARTLMGLAEETFSGAYFNAATFCSWLFDDAVAGFLSSGGFEPAELLTDRVTVFVQVPLPTLYASPAVVRVILDAVMWAAIEADGEYARRILVQIDECKRIGKLSAVDLVLGVGRKYGLTLDMAWLSEAEVIDTYGKEGLEYFHECVSWRSYGAIRGRETARALSSELGEHAVIATSEGINSGKSGKPMEIGSKSSGDNTNRHEVKRALIKPDELMEARTDELFVVAHGKKLRCGRALYFRRDEMVAVTDENRYVKGITHA